jgi:rhodanese-related sulfurtransferase
MTQNITKHVKDMVDEANAEVVTTPVADAANFYNDNNYVFVDIRDPREIKREGKIPNSLSCPRGMLEFWIDPDSPYHKKEFNQDKHYVFYCAAAGRSALAAKVAKDMGLKPVSHLEGGFALWKRSGNKIDIVE